MPLSFAGLFPGVIGTFMGRDALLLAATSLNLHASDIVLLPSYLCGEIIKPFSRMASVVFYKLRPDLTVEPEEIERSTRKKTKVVLIINYFGFLQPFRKAIRKICTDRSITLIEDCAHSLLTFGSGETGDLSVFSYRKLLPVPDGGGLKINTKEITPAFRYYPRMYSDFLSFMLSFKKLLNVHSSFLSRAGLSTLSKDILNNGEMDNKHERLLPMSSFARNGFVHLSTNEIAEKRRSNFVYWQEFAEKTAAFTPVIPQLLEGVCPMGFPVRVKERDSLKSMLLKNGVYLETHWNLPSFISMEFKESQLLSKETLTLPVSSTLDEKTRTTIESALVYYSTEQSHVH